MFSLLRLIDVFPAEHGDHPLCFPVAALLPERIERRIGCGSERVIVRPYHPAKGAVLVAARLCMSFPPLEKCVAETSSPVARQEHRLAAVEDLGRIVTMFQERRRELLVMPFER